MAERRERDKAGAHLISRTGLDPRLEFLNQHIRERQKDLPHYDFILGLDEVGVACLAGPVVAGAFLYSINEKWVKEWGEFKGLRPRVDDSKKLSPKLRQNALLFLEKLCPAWNVTAEASTQEIDRLNIYWASKLAMRRCIESLMEKVPELRNRKTLVLIDGNKELKDLHEFSKHWDCEAVVKGDGKLFPVAAASIFAKEFRDSMMGNLSLQFPVYGWERNMGYPSPEHKKAIKQHGISPWHRLSFESNLQTSLF